MRSLPFAPSEAQRGRKFALTDQLIVVAIVDVVVAVVVVVIVVIVVVVIVVDIVTFMHVD